MIFFQHDLSIVDPLRLVIKKFYRQDETECVQSLLKNLHFDQDIQNRTKNFAQELVQSVRNNEAERSGIEQLMMHYDLSTEEGIMLMCLAEVLLRIPDQETEDLLIRDKLTSVKWEKHLGQSEFTFVNMATWGLALGGKILKKPTDAQNFFWKIWKNLLTKSSESVIRKAVREAIKLLSEHFVLGRNIHEALERSKQMITKGYNFSYDMLGEVARTQKDADRYFNTYKSAIRVIGESFSGKNLFHGPSISVKLSALYPRYEANKRETAVPVLIERLKDLATQAKQAGI